MSISEDSYRPPDPDMPEYPYEQDDYTDFVYENLLLPGETLDDLAEDFANEEYPPVHEEVSVRNTFSALSSLPDRDFEEVQNILSAYQLDQNLHVFKGVCKQILSSRQKMRVPSNKAFLNTLDGQPFATICIPGSQASNVSGRSIPTGIDAQQTIFDYLDNHGIPVWYMSDTGVRPPDVYITMAFDRDDLERCGAIAVPVRGGTKYTFPDNPDVPVVMSLNVSRLEHIKYQKLLATNEEDIKRYHEQDSKAREKFAKYKEKMYR